MNDSMLKPMDVVKIVWSYRRKMAVAFGLVLVLVTLAFFFVPRVWTSELTLHISGNYFQNPLLGDLVAQIYDPGEVREEREKIIRSSLGVKYATESGEKNKLFKTDANDPRRPYEVEAFLNGISVFSMTATQFKIRLKANSPEAADGMIRDAVAAVRESMFKRRTLQLERLLDVLATEISHAASDNTVLPGDLKGGPGAPGEAAKSAVAVQIDRLNERLAELRTSYNEQHPAVQKIKNDIARLRSRGRGDFDPEGGRKGILDRDHANAVGSITKEDLTKRRHMVNMSYEMEKRDPSMSSYVSVVEEPTYPKRTPKRRVFALALLIGGFLASLIPVALGEYWRRMSLDAGDVSASLGTHVLGELRLPPGGP